MSTKIITYESIAEHLTNLRPEWAIELAEPWQLREAIRQDIPFNSPGFHHRILGALVVEGLVVNGMIFVRALERAGAIKFNDFEFKP